MNYQHIRVEPLSTWLGAEVAGVDLAAPVAEKTFAEIRHAFGEYGVVFFRDQRLTPEQHVAFAERFAPVDINRFFSVLPGYPMIAEVRKEPEQTRNIGGGWHTDHSYDQVPALGSMLYAREVPKTGGPSAHRRHMAAWRLGGLAAWRPTPAAASARNFASRLAVAIAAFRQVLAQSHFDAENPQVPFAPGAPRRSALPRCQEIAAYAGVAAEPARPRLDEFLPCRRADRLRHIRRFLSGASRLVAGRRRYSAWLAGAIAGV